MQVELKSCPFCGNENPNLIENCIDDPVFALATIKCRKCGAESGKIHRTTESAIAWWNGRTKSSMQIDVDVAIKAATGKYCEITRNYGHCCPPMGCWNKPNCAEVNDIAAAIREAAEKEESK